MISLKNVSVAAIGLLITLSTHVFAQTNVGEEAPDFTYTSLDNVQYTLSELQGKVVYIFLFGAQCPHCRANGPVTETQIYQSFNHDTNFVALGLDTWNTSASSVINFRSATGITYPLLLEAEQSLFDFYGNSGAYDRSLVIAKDGKIAYKGTGFVNSDVEQVKNSITAELSVTTSNESSDLGLPDHHQLDQNYPNPFNPSTTIRFSLSQPTNIQLKVYDILGAEIATLLNTRLAQGEQNITWDASNQSSGIYFYRLITDEGVLTKKMMLIK